MTTWFGQKLGRFADDIMSILDLQHAKTWYDTVDLILYV